MLQMLQSQNYGLKQLTNLKVLCAFKNHKRREWKITKKPFHYILSPNPKVAAT